jgi:hypothetical protein
VERRQDNDDRRKIERFSSPPVRAHYRQINIFIHFLTLLSFAAGVFHLGRGFYIGQPREVTMGVFMAVLAFVLTYFLFAYGKSLSDYLANESLGNLDRATEKQVALWFVISFLTVAYTLVYFIFG